MSETAFFDRVVTAEQARGAADRLIAAAFHSANTELPHFRIPTQADDDDVVLIDYIEQAKAALAAAQQELKEAGDCYFEHVTVLVDQAEQRIEAAQQAQREVEAERDDLCARLGVYTYPEAAHEIGSLQTALHETEAALARVREVLYRVANPKPDEYDAFGFVAHLRDEARAALETIQTSESNYAS